MAKMANKKDHEKLQADRHQLIIQELLRDDDNKYCVDCDAKGPRWASWNIGVFLCIRCAGIHRNLGVHISKVKSINLDTWTVAQLAMMRSMGNSRARAVYEALLPDNFRRPQSDAALENFIRAKYEHKRYMSPEYVPEQPDIESLLKDIQRLEQANKKPRHPMNTVALVPLSRPTVSAKSSNKISSSSLPNAAEPNLLNLNTTSATSKPAAQPIDLFSQFDAENATSNGQQTSQVHNVSGGTVSSDLLGLHFGDPSSSMAMPSIPANLQGLHTPPAPLDSTGQKVSKDAILALYQKSPVGANSGLCGPFAPSSGFELNHTSNITQWTPGAVSSSFCDFSREPAKPSAVTAAAPASYSLPNAPPTVPTNHQALQNPFEDFAAWSSSSSTAGPPQFSQTGPQFPFATQPVPGTFSDSFFTPANSQAKVGAPLHQPGSGFPTTGSFFPGPLHPIADSHQAYLSRVQNQLAGLQLNNTANCPQ